MKMGTTEPSGNTGKLPTFRTQKNHSRIHRPAPANTRGPIRVVHIFHRAYYYHHLFIQ